LDAKAAKSIDEDLMSPSGGFSLDQLMELAGLSVASAALEVMSHHGRQGRRVLVLCGPGNNGGDGLVAARHLSHFGYNPEIYFPDKRPKFPGLIMQCENLNIPTLSALPSLDDYDLVIDAVFGFSFKGPLRSEYRPAISAMAASRSPVLAVDIPSGWDVEKGDVFETGFRPAAVVSLTAPKMCLSDYTGLHYVGGRSAFVAFLSSYITYLPIICAYYILNCIGSCRLPSRRSTESRASTTARGLSRWHLVACNI
jgi:NAD(P)H-hydrate epimerase